MYMGQNTWSNKILSIISQFLVLSRSKVIKMLKGEMSKSFDDLNVMKKFPYANAAVFRRCSSSITVGIRSILTVKSFLHGKISLLITQKMVCEKVN